MGDFFTSKNDAQLAKDIVSQSADIYIMQNETPVSEVGALDKGVPASSTFTPAVSPAWVIDALVGQIFVLQDDNNNAYEFVVVSNTAAEITFDITSDVDGIDQSAKYTDTNSFSYTLWGVEQFIGYTDESEFNDEEELKEFKTGIPRKKVREDLLEKTVSLETVIRTPGAGVLKAVFNLKDDSDATYYILKGGSNPGSNRSNFYIILKNSTVAGKAQQLRLYWVQLNANGARSIGGGDEYETIPVRMAINGSPLHDEAEDYYRIRIEK